MKTVGGGGRREVRIVRWGVGVCKTRTHSFAIYQKIFFLSFKAVVSSRENFYLCMSKMCSLNELKAEQDEKYFVPVTKNKEAASWPSAASFVTHAPAPTLSLSPPS